MDLRHRGALPGFVLVAAMVGSSSAKAQPESPPGARDYRGPQDTATPSGETPPGEQPVPEQPAPAPAPASAEQDEAPSGFVVEDLTEDKAALERELKPQRVEVQGAHGTVKGRVLDATTGKPLVGVNIIVVATRYKTRTNLDGNYELPLPPGRYDLRIWYDAYESRRISGVVIKDNDTLTHNADLEPAAGAVQTVVVEAKARKEGEAARLLQRKQSAATRDIISREQIKRSGDSSAGTAARRVVGSTVMGNRYLFVRGLGHRYGNTLLDGARVPGTEPDLRTVPLDVFPAGALGGINVQKTFTPDMPADFVGGSTQLETREAPEKFVFDVGAWIGWNTATTHRMMLTNGAFPGQDAFAFGNLVRGIPGSFPSDKPVSNTYQEVPFENYYTPEQIETYGEALLTDTRVRRGIAPPNFGVNATIGHTFEPWQTRLGVILALGYDATHQTIRETIKRLTASDEDGDGAIELNAATPRVDFKGKRTTFNVSWNALGLIKWDLTRDHALSWSTLYTRDADDETRELNGVLRTNTEDVYRNTRIRYVMRSILFNRFGGKHIFRKAKNLRLDWFGSYSQARRDDPSYRDMLFLQRGDQYYFDVVSSGHNIFFDLTDDSESGSVDLTLPFKQWFKLDAKFKLGVWVEGKQREFLVRRFRFLGLNPMNVPVGTSNIIDNGNIGGGVPGQEEAFFVKESTRTNDNYAGRQELYATYAMVDLPLVRWMRIVGGARFEASTIRVRPFDPFGVKDVTQERGRVQDLDVLPGVALIFPATDEMNVRLASSRTIARPEFRELAPFLFTDFVGGVDVTGNPKLESTRVWNADLRWEWFPTASEVVAVSGFFKHFQDPIERVLNYRNTRATFVNAPGAINVGAELEGRKSLEFIWKMLRDVSIGANFAYIYSRVRLGELHTCEGLVGQALIDCEEEVSSDRSTSRERPMFEQSPFVVNTFLAYENAKSGTFVRLLFNTFGRRIAFVGSGGLPDIYQEPIHGLDLAVSQRIYRGLSASLNARNLLDWPEIRRQQNIVVYRTNWGTTINVGLNYSF